MAKYSSLQSAPFDPSAYKDLNSLLKAVKSPADIDRLNQALDNGTLHLKYKDQHVAATRDDVTSCVVNEARLDGIQVPPELMSGKRRADFIVNEDGSTSVTLSAADGKSSFRLTQNRDGSEDIAVARRDGSFQSRHIDARGMVTDPQNTDNGLKYRVVDQGTGTLAMPSEPKHTAPDAGKNCFGKSRGNPSIMLGPG